MLGFQCPTGLKTEGFANQQISLTLMVVRSLKPYAILSCAIQVPSIAFHAANIETLFQTRAT